MASTWSADERALAVETINRASGQVLVRRDVPLDEVISETLYHEQLRLEHATGPQADSDRAFYSRVRHEFRHGGEARQRRLVHTLVVRYVQEIAGHFDPRVYAIATRALPAGLSVLLHGLSPREVLAHLPHLPQLSDRLFFEGEVETLLSLAKRGTVVLAPTHSSNLDSLLMGYAIYQMGLPPFAYGAGLNLFSNPMMSFFMHHLGAYTVDRQKSDPLYLLTLKTYATASLEHGQHNVYFPGGTRSRSGAVETHLKKGLLGTTVAAFQDNLASGRLDGRIFIVPCTCSYPLVLEAETLIRQYLLREGKERYVEADDEFSRLRRWVAFLRGLLALDLRIHVVIGKPLDPFGNDVDPEGASHDPRGRTVDPARYLLTGGHLSRDDERDAEYTRMLATRLVEAYHRDTVALPTSVLAFAFLELIRRRMRQPDLYRLLRSVGPETSLPIQDVQRETGRLLEELNEHGNIRLSVEARTRDVPTLMAHALETFASYHTQPVIEQRDSRLHVGDAELLFFYRNRLEGRGLLGAPSLIAQGGPP